jgi:hypothetical protein
MDSTSRRPVVWLAWALCGLVVVLSMLLPVLALAVQRLTLAQFFEISSPALGIPFAVVAALIMSRQPGNRIGWLLMLPPLVMPFGWLANFLLARLDSPPPNPSLPLLMLIWFSGWGWVPFVFPVLLIPLFFPTGRPPGRHWWWVAAALGAEAVIFILLATFVEDLTPVTVGVAWSVPNPIGFIPDAQIQAALAPWGIVLLTLAVLSVASLFVRYRRAGAIERTQLRWLLFACALFLVVYLPAGSEATVTETGEPTLLGFILNLGFGLATTAIPVAIAIAILRYRLWDIDVVIRRTLVYTVLSAVLALAYFGSVLVLQNVSRFVTGQEQSGLVVVVSTLAIAALFVPVRSRVQAAIDRRFYRRKYDAAYTLASFAAGARDEVELEHLSGRLVEVVQETMQPSHVSLWLKTTGRR